MITCKKCGRELADDAKFCDKCGTPVTANTETDITKNADNADEELKQAAEQAEAVKADLNQLTQEAKTEEAKTENKQEESENKRHENGYSNPAKQNLKDYFTDESVAALGGDIEEIENDNSKKTHSKGISKARLVIIEVVAVIAAVALGVSSVVIFSSKHEKNKPKSVADIQSITESNIELQADTTEKPTKKTTEKTTEETTETETETETESETETETTTTTTTAPETETESQELITSLVVPARIDFTQGYVSNPNGTTFRYGPGMNYAEKDYLDANQAVWMINYQDGWYFVEYYGIDGWIPESAWTEGAGGNYDYSTLYGYGYDSGSGYYGDGYGYDNGYGNYDYNYNGGWYDPGYYYNGGNSSSGSSSSGSGNSGGQTPPTTKAPSKPSDTTKTTAKTEKSKPKTTKSSETKSQDSATESK